MFNNIKNPCPKRGGWFTSVQDLPTATSICSSMWDKLLGQKKHVGQMALSNIPPFNSYTYTFGTKKKNKTTLGKFFCWKFFLHRGKPRKFRVILSKSRPTVPKLDL
jgi:hypothetical protein